MAEPPQKKPRSVEGGGWGAGEGRWTGSSGEGELVVTARVADACGGGAANAHGGIRSGICFLDHMIDQLTAHAQLQVSVQASLAGREASARGNDFAREAVDEQAAAGAGAALGSALRALLAAGPAPLKPGEFCFCAPLDEAFTELKLEFTGAVASNGGGGGSAELSLAPYGCYPKEGRKKIGSFRTCLTEVFFKSLATALGCRLTARKVRGDNAHHVVEATFKSFARCLRRAMDAAAGFDAAAASASMAAARGGEKKRSTKETSIDVSVRLDPAASEAAGRIATGVTFLDGLLRDIETASGFRIRAECSGDVWIDEHHSAEDVAITLGQTLAVALGDKGGCTRMAFAEGSSAGARVRCVMDLSNRPCLCSDLRLEALGEEKAGDLSLEMIAHCFESLAMSSMMTAHLEQLPSSGGSGEPSAADVATAAARAFGAALGACASIDPRRAGAVSSSKGTLSK